MNYFLLALAIFAALIAVSEALNILRVAFGKAVWNSGFAALWAFTVTPAAAVAALWLFQAAVAG